MFHRISLKYAGTNREGIERIGKSESCPSGKEKFRFHSCQGGIITVNNSNHVEQDEFHKKLKKEWKLMWTERFDDRTKGEGIVTRDHPLIFMDRGSVIFASRDVKTPTFSEIVELWAARGSIYAPQPAVGGWGKFIRTQLRSASHSRARKFASDLFNLKANQCKKKHAKGWLHIT